VKMVEKLKGQARLLWLKYGLKKENFKNQVHSKENATRECGKVEGKVGHKAFECKVNTFHLHITLKI